MQREISVVNAPPLSKTPHLLAPSKSKCGPADKKFTIHVKSTHTPAHHTNLSYSSPISRRRSPRSREKQKKKQHFIHAPTENPAIMTKKTSKVSVVFFITKPKPAAASRTHAHTEPPTTHCTINKLVGEKQASTTKTSRHYWLATPAQTCRPRHTRTRYY